MLKMTAMALMMLNFSANDNPDYDSCVKAKPCPNDGKNMSELSEQEQHKTYHCRVKRHMECTFPKENK